MRAALRKPVGRTRVWVMQPLDRYPLDATILFSGILTIPDTMDLDILLTWAMVSSNLLIQKKVSVMLEAVREMSPACH